MILETATIGKESIGSSAYILIFVQGTMNRESFEFENELLSSFNPSNKAIRIYKRELDGYQNKRLNRFICL
jgi:hypothetical protein